MSQTTPQPQPGRKPQDPPAAPEEAPQMQQAGTPGPQMGSGPAGPRQFTDWASI